MRTIRYLAIFPVLAVFASTTTIAYAQSSFKISYQADDTKVVLNVQNPPTFLDASGTTQLYSQIILSRDASGFTLTNVDGSPVAHGGDADSYLVRPGTAYNDTSVAAGKTYKYEAVAREPGQPDKGPVTISVAFKVPGANGQTSTTAYQPLFQTSTDLSLFVQNFVRWMTNVIGPSLAGFALLWAGYQYAASAGDETQIKAAKELVFGALLGLALLILIGAVMRSLFL